MARVKQTSRKSTGGRKKRSSPLVIESDDLAKLTVVKLKERCAKMGIECKGKKADLIRAIIDAEGKHSVRSTPSSITIPTKTSTKKKVKSVTLSPPRYNYDKMTLVELKKECKKRQLKDSNRKCPSLPKKELVELLKLWDGLDLPEVVSSSASETSVSESPIKVVRKKTTKKKSPVKKTTTKKKSPVKKASAKKAVKTKKTVTLSPPKYNYDKMTLPELKKECRKRQLKDPKTRKCPNISKTRMVELLKLWDGMDLPEVVSSSVSETSFSESPVKVVRKKTSIKKKSPVKKATTKKATTKKATTKKATIKKEVKEVTLSPPKYNYDKMTLPELKKECRKRQLKDPKTRKCPNISKTRMVELLKLWDGMDLPEVVTSEEISEEEISEEMPVKATRKTSKKPAAKKKTSVKKSPVKKSTTKKKTSSKKRCDDEEDYEECDEDKVCSASSGKCIKDTNAARKGKVELHVDGRVIIGTDKVIKDLQKVLGGKIIGASSPVKKTTPKKKTTSKKKSSPSPLFTQEEKEAYKKRVSGQGVITHKASPDVFDLFKSEEESEAESEEERLEDLLKVKPKRKTPVKKTKQKTKVEKKTPVKVLKQRDIIQKTFEECLESLGGEM